MSQPPRLLLAAAATGVLALLTSGCGNDVTTDIIGMTAVTVDDAGRPVVLVQVCTGDVDEVQVFGGREGLDDDQPNPEIGAWRSQQAQSGTVQIPVATSVGPWTTANPIAFELREHYIVYASSSDADAETMQVDFEGSDLAELGPGQVLVRDGKVWTRDRFDEQACQDL